MTAPSIDAVSGLVEELRSMEAAYGNTSLHPYVLYGRAADALEAQARELAEARSDETFCADATIDTSADSIAGLVTSNDEARAVEVAVQRALVFMRSLCNLRLQTAQTRIAALEDAVRGKDEALRPFAKAGELFVQPWSADLDALIYGPAAGPDFNITAGDLRRARTALSNGEPHDR